MKTLTQNNRQESGSATVVLAIGVAGLVALWKLTPHLLANYHPAIYWTMVAGASIVTICALGCAIHMRSIGASSHKIMVEDAKIKTQELRHLLRASVETVEILENKMVDKGYHLSPKGIECLSTARKILMALETRYNTVRRLLESKRYINLIHAGEELDRPLVISQSSLDVLIDTDPIPPIDARDLGFTLDRLFRQIETEIRAIDEKLQQYVNE